LLLSELERIKIESFNPEAKIKKEKSYDIELYY
jgi:hypothetical protein